MADEGSLVGPLVLAATIDFVGDPLPSIGRAVLPSEVAEALFLAVQEFAHILGIVCVPLDSVTVLFTVFPLAYVFCAADVGEFPDSIHELA